MRNAAIRSISRLIAFLDAMSVEAMKYTNMPGPQGLPACPFCHEWDKFIIGPHRYGVNWFYAVDFLTCTVECTGCGTRMTAYRRTNKSKWEWFNRV